MEILRKSIPYIILGIVMVLFGFLYSADYQYPPCCDTAITLIKAKVIAESGIIHSIMPVNPSRATPLYTSLVSSEIGLHLVLAAIYKIFPATVVSLTFAKYFFLVLFVAATVPLFWFARELFKRWELAVMAVVFAYLSFWFGNMYWTGHVAQMLGIFFLLFGLLFLYRYKKNEKPLYLILAGVVALLLFIIHVLTFLVFILVAVTVLFIMFWRNQEIKWYTGGLAVLVYAVAVGVFFKVMPPGSLITPSFTIVNLGNPFDQILAHTVSDGFLFVLFGVGLYYSIRQKKYVVLTLFGMIYLLSQSEIINSSFYAYRFNEYIVLPITLIAVGGIQYLLTLPHMKRFSVIILILLLVVFIPFGVEQQLDARKCYIKNCADLHPTQVLEGDMAAFDWLRNNQDSSTIVISTPKFGYYIPVVSNVMVEFPDGEKNLIYTDQASERRWSVAKQYDIEYIIIDALFRAQKKVLGHNDFSFEAFQNEQFFELVFDYDGAQIYKVK